MVLLFAKEGQLANRLWQGAYFLANAMEHKYRLMHLGFAEYYIYFNENLHFHPNRKDKWKIFDFKGTSTCERALIKYANLSKDNYERHNKHYPFVSELNFFDFLPGAQGYELSQDAFLKNANKNIFLVNGWQFIDDASLKKHAVRIKEIFTPNKNFTANVDRLKANCYASYDFMIGVHLRKGDYASFNEGRWLFTNADYVSFMQQVNSLPCLAGLKVGFLLCSDEPIEWANFSGLPVVGCSGNAVEDLYSLAFCDLIIGPVSTFSSWASFYGGRPLLHIKDKNLKINRADFKIAVL